jgi:hypothetical protein
MKRATAIAIKTGVQLAKAGCDVVQFTSALTGATRDRVAAARRGIRKRRNAAEDFFSECALSVRKHPLKSVGVTFGVAFGPGALAPGLARRK